MFTGIVREVGRVRGVEERDGGMRLLVEAAHTAAGVAVGDSVAIDGACLTAEEVAAETMTFHAVSETLARTTLGALVAGDRVNIEPAVRAGEPLGGHLVQGHVDAIGRVRSAIPEGAGRRVVVDAPAAVLRYCVEKGSVTVAGVSLTVAALDGDGFGVVLVPHTLEATTLGALDPGTAVNLEADVLAKYVERLLVASER